MTQISVLMSIYSEPLNLIKEAVESIRNQTFQDFEYLVVVDNPENKKAISYLKKVAEQDSRIYIIINVRNLGLARSLNVAAEKAKGEYLARMDADDVSKPERLERELQYLKKNGLDMVSCIADKIDENGTITGEITTCPQSTDEAAALLSCKNIIIHPTVMMRADVFKELGGYRNFPTCQDYDFWLRLITNKYTVGVLNEKLLSFRRHSGSITAKRHFNQCLNEQYIRILYEERQKHSGEDSFTEDNLQEFLSKNGIQSEKKVVKQSQCLDEYKLGIQCLKESHYGNGLIHLLRSIRSDLVRHSVYTSARVRIIRKKYGKRK